MVFSMTNSPSIVPSSEQLRHWEDLIFDEDENADVVLTQAFQAGADQELQECINFVYDNKLCDPNFYNDLRAARRPKTPSLKEQACDALDAYVYGNPDHGDKQNTYNIIRRALEALPND